MNRKSDSLSAGRGHCCPRPFNADIHDIEVISVPEHDEIVNRIGVIGLGEAGLIGTAAAIANAVYHATGKRVRDLPITIDKLLSSSQIIVDRRGHCQTW